MKRDNYDQPCPVLLYFLWKLRCYFNSANAPAPTLRYPVDLHEAAERAREHLARATRRPDELEAIAADNQAAFREYAARSLGIDLVGDLSRRPRKPVFRTHVPEGYEPGEPVEPARDTTEVEDLADVYPAQEVEPYPYDGEGRQR